MLKNITFHFPNFSQNSLSIFSSSATSRNQPCTLSFFLSSFPVLSASCPFFLFSPFFFPFYPSNKKPSPLLSFLLSFLRTLPYSSSLTQSQPFFSLIPIAFHLPTTSYTLPLLSSLPYSSFLLPSLLTILLFSPSQVIRFPFYPLTSSFPLSLSPFPLHLQTLSIPFPSLYYFFRYLPYFLYLRYCSFIISSTFSLSTFSSTFLYLYLIIIFIFLFSILFIFPSYSNLFILPSNLSLFSSNPPFPSPLFFPSPALLLFLLPLLIIF